MSSHLGALRGFWSAALPELEDTAFNPRGAVIPRATYRIQLNASFTFKDATAIIPYLAALGISHVYCSPYFRARAGSTHGYDVVDHNSFNPEIGDRADFENFVSELRAHAMGHVLDIVPNHVGIMGSENAWWMDVLENGQASVYAEFFDIDWTPANPALADKVLVPVLGDAYGIVLERGELELRFERELGSFAVFYHEHRFPLDPRTYPRVLDRVLAHTSKAEIKELRRAFSVLPERREPTEAQIKERDREKEIHKRALAALCASDDSVAQAIDAALRSFAGDPAEPASFDALHELIEEQAYRLANWRVASDDINYRRFFDVNSLAALRVENEAVFEATHKLLLELVAAGKIDGLRIDHPDGLYDPAGYFTRLQKRIADVTSSTATLPIYLVVEKITASFEHLPPNWPVHGETGYHFANVVNRMLVDAATRTRMDRVYRGFIDEPLEWQNVAYECQHLVLRRSLASELNVVANRLARIAQGDRRTRDFTFNSLRHALAEVIACFPVYRTYVTDCVSDNDRRYIEWAVASAKRRRSATEGPVLDFVRAALLLELPAPTGRIRDRMRAFTMKFQQITAPITAKGVEDTALYRFNRLTSLNEVGGEPDAYGTSVRAFHADSQHRARCWPHEMLATSTHDTKRSGDVRARINVLSEMTMLWRKAIERWSRMNRTRKREVDGRPAPSPNDEYLLYQTLIGSWPLEDLDEAGHTAYRERIEAYMIKAVREAKLRTSWANINAEYEEAVAQFVRATLEVREGNLFLADFSALQRRLTRFGLFNSLSQILCELTAPGVPDIYQGNDIWDFSLVDPDNRRPVDYEKRGRMLAQLQELDTLPSQPQRLRSLLENINDGRCKLLLTWKALQFRRSHRELFRRGEYLPLRVTGEHASNICAFARRYERELAIAIAPRLYLRLLGERDQLPLGADIWENTTIELPRGYDPGGGALRNALDGSDVAAGTYGERAGFLAADALGSFPVALLYRARN
ncbi:MAG: bifunctional 4-alpha-glucanotransferase/malto-oligosyltrehalose synthase [Gammaproteobacteria bacterium]|nr:bifunctional 4-alpha-glucanotransferase/malto-oligosyltrehalose synthase [Gammaproteobacteria bacterium]